MVKMDQSLRASAALDRRLDLSLNPLADPSLTALADPSLKTLTEPSRKRLANAGNISIDQLLQSAEQSVKNIKINPRILDFLYQHSRADSPSRELWERQVRFAVAINRLMVDCFSPFPFDRIRGAIDESSKGRASEQLNRPHGMLVLTFHGGFPQLARGLFDDMCKDGITLQRKGSREGKVSATSDPGASLFAALRMMQEGRNVLMAPDGPFGKPRECIHVLGIACPVADGAAFLAYHASCNTVWYSLERTDRAFSPIVVAGPRREPGERFEEFRTRLYRFYAERIEEALTGDPRSLAISGRWGSRISKALS